MIRLIFCVSVALLAAQGLAGEWDDIRIIYGQGSEKLRLEVPGLGGQKETWDRSQHFGLGLYNTQADAGMSSVLGMGFMSHRCTLEEPAYEVEYRDYTVRVLPGIGIGSRSFQWEILGAAGIGYGMVDLNTGGQAYDAAGFMYFYGGESNISVCLFEGFLVGVGANYLWTKAKYDLDGKSRFDQQGYALQAFVGWRF